MVRAFRDSELEVGQRVSGTAHALMERAANQVRLGVLGLQADGFVEVMEGPILVGHRKAKTQLEMPVRIFGMALDIPLQVRQRLGLVARAGIGEAAIAARHFVIRF